jgi:hypothetical protein
VTIAAFSVGALSIDQVEVIVRTVRSCDDARACGIARHALVGQPRRALRRYRYDPHPTSGEHRRPSGSDSANEPAAGARPSDEARERGADGEPDGVDDVDGRTDESTTARSSPRHSSTRSPATEPWCCSPSEPVGRSAGRRVRADEGHPQPPPPFRARP